MKKLILLVEDDPTDEKLTLRAFGVQPDMTIQVAKDGVDALDFLAGAGRWKGRDTAQLPALMIVDLKLPRIDGLEVLRRVRADERTRCVPVLVLTASKEDQDITRSYQLGANAYVRKPIDFKEFVETARTIARFWLTLAEQAPSRWPTA